MWMKTSARQSGRPASSTSTRTAGSALRRAGSALPADPPPTITTSWANLLSRDLPVDHGEVHALALAVEPRAHVDGDGQHVQRAHEDQRAAVVDPVDVIGQPLDQAEPQEHDERS